MFLLIIIIFVACCALYAHPGAVDARNGHKDETGWYHQHFKDRTIYLPANRPREPIVSQQPVAPQQSWPSQQQGSNPPVAEPSFWSSGKVLKVIDGDTIEAKVIGKQGGHYKVRLIGVDTPESVHPRKEVEPYSLEAKAFLEKLIGNQVVNLYFDPLNNKKDKYGRYLCYVQRRKDKLLVNKEIILNGFSRAYTKYPFSLKDDFILAEEIARKKRIAIWSSSVPNQIELHRGLLLDTYMNEQTKRECGLDRLSEKEYVNLNNYIEAVLEIEKQRPDANLTLDPLLESIDNLEGALILSQDDAFLGKISKKSHSGDSISNEYGEHGSEYKENSIFNKYRKYGSELSNLSPYNPVASKPPMIHKDGKLIYYLTVNKTIFPRLDPHLLEVWIKHNQ